MLLHILSFIRERFEKIRGYLVRPLSVSGRTRFGFRNDSKHGEERWVFATTGGLFIRNSKDLRITERRGGEMCWPYDQGIVLVWF